MGFSVEQTALSGDGGIDVIAYSNQPVFKGKYLIQCKNWNNVVGQPEVRDLFGVVMSEHANKGILITTSHFTEQAVQFADKKNIELIGHDVLIKLLSDYGLLEETENNKNIEMHFTDFDGFDKAKYTYLKSKVENNRTEKLYYDNLKEFYHQYIISNKYEINKNGLIDEYIILNNEIIKRFCKKNKERVAEGNGVKYINAFLYILKGNIFTAIEIYSDLGLLVKSSKVDFSATSFGFHTEQGDSSKIEELNVVWKNHPYTNVPSFYEYISKVDYSSSTRIVLKNLYLLFNKLSYSIGIDVNGKF